MGLGVTNLFDVATQYDRIAQNGTSWDNPGPIRVCYAPPPKDADRMIRRVSVLSILFKVVPPILQTMLLAHNEDYPLSLRMYE